MQNRSNPTAAPDPQALLAEAIEHHRSGRLPEAERLYRRILKASPGHADAMHLLGLIAQRAGQGEEAVRLIRQAIALNPAPAYHSNLAMVFEEQGRYEEAGRAAREALTLDPWNGPALHCLANALRIQDRYEEAADAYERATRVVSEDPALWSNYGATLQTLGRHEAAIPVLQQARRLSPGQPEIHSNLGIALNACGRRGEAEAAHREAIRLDPGFAAAYTNLGNLYLQTGRAREAAKVLREGLRASPGNRRALAYLAAAAGETGDHETRDLLLDFNRFLAERAWEPPAGFDTLEQFNAALVEHATRHGSLLWEPPSKTTRGGSQTGELLDETPGPVAALEIMIREAVAEYLEKVGDDTGHPWLATRPADWKLTMWATVLDRGGRQDPHVHPSGWLSGVYYAAVPRSVEGSEPQAGWIEFGQPPSDFRLLKPPATRRREPREGHMFLFPSYFYHRTLPFEGEGQRVSIAFDLVPREPEDAGTAARPGSLSSRELSSEKQRAEALLQTGQAGEAAAVCRRVVAAAPGDAYAHYLMGVALFRMPEIEQATAALERAIELDPDMPRFHMDLATCYRHAGRDDDAARHFERAAELGPEQTQALMRLADLHIDQQRYEQAVATYEEVIRRDPKIGGAHYGIASHKRYEPGDPHIDRMRALADEGGFEPNEEVLLCFALGRALDQNERVDEAMEWYHRGNRAKRRLVDFDIGDERRNTRRIVEAFTPELYRNREDTGHDSELPVFVLGMPRSGTTLVEQILDSHPEVRGAGELNDLWRLVNTISQQLPPGVELPESVDQVPAAIWSELGRRYSERLSRFAPEASRVVDKLPFNYTLVGLIRLALPKARIVHCVRDPRDTCVSCYLISFGNDRGFTYDLAELGEAYRLYWRLMEHWKSLFPGVIHEVRYEGLVGNVEGESRRLIDHLGLEWSDRCLDYHENRRIVATASTAQVRKPVYRSSIGRWRRYEAHLGPLLEALGDLRQYGIDEERDQR